VATTGDRGGWAHFTGLPPLLPTLTGGGVLLRVTTEDDVPAVVTASRDPQTVRWTTVPTPYGESDALGWIALQRDWLTQGSALSWGVAFATEPAAWCGGIDLRITRPRFGTAEIGLTCAPWARRRGLATVAVALVAAHAFDVLGLGRLEWQTLPGNMASQLTALRAGFVPEGVQRGALVDDGRRVDAWSAALLRDDPRPSPAAVTP
jgi:RimJ/RimL family protein N-acetyltransferase